MTRLLNESQGALFHSTADNRKLLTSTSQLENLKELVSFSTDAETVEELTAALNAYRLKLERFGIWKRLFWLSSVIDAPNIIKFELNKVKSIFTDLANFRIKPRYCTFQRNIIGLRQLSCSEFNPIFHSLEKHEIQALLRSLQFYESVVDANAKSFGSYQMSEILEIAHDGGSMIDQSRAFGIRDANQLLFLSSLKFSEVPRLIGYLKSQIYSDIFSFCNKDLEMKKLWPLEVDAGIDKLRKSDTQFNKNVRALESYFIEQEQLMVKNCDSPVLSILGSLFKSQEELLSKYPLF
jgi:hypothetical protein